MARNIFVFCLIFFYTCSLSMNKNIGIFSKKGVLNVARYKGLGFSKVVPKIEVLNEHGDVIGVSPESVFQFPQNNQLEDNNRLESIATNVSDQSDPLDAFLKSFINIIKDFFVSNGCWFRY